MPLNMVRPYQHPKTGVYWLRKVVPEPLRAILGRRELKETLRTKDPREAKRKAPAVLAKFNAILAGAAQAAQTGTSHATLRDLMALGGEWYRAAIADWGNDPDQIGDLDIYEDLLREQVERFEGDDQLDAPAPKIKFSARDLGEAAELLKGHHYPTDPDTVQRLARIIFGLKFQFATELRRRLDGDWTPDTTLEKLPTLAPRSVEASPVVTFQSLIDAWAVENGANAKGVHDRGRTAARLAAFLGHDDAARLSAEDVVSWKEARLKEGVSNATVANDFGELRPIWTWAKRNRKLTFAENPFSGLAPKIRKFNRSRGPYTMAEARKILTMARDQKGLLRWLPWVVAFTGARIGEVAQATKEDIRREGNGPWFIHLHADGANRSLKTRHSERLVPLHPALIAEGFLDYVSALKGGSLWPGLKPDRFGSMATNAIHKNGQWVRKVVGLTDHTKAPAHAWRHLFEDRAKRAGVPQSMTDALMGHLNAANESEGYGRGFRFMPDTTAPYVAKMADPMTATV